MRNEIIATALEQLAYAIREYPMQSAIVTKVLIANEDTTAPDLSIQFSVGSPKAKLRPLEVEIALEQSKKAAATLTLMVLNTETEKVEARETVHLKHLDDAYPYFENALELFNPEEME